jgi:hypothetical protein
MHAATEREKGKITMYTVFPRKNGYCIVDTFSFVF